MRTCLNTSKICMAVCSVLWQPFGDHRPTMSNSQSSLCAEVKVPQSLHPRIALFLLSGKGGVSGPDHALTG